MQKIFKGLHIYTNVKLRKMEFQLYKKKYIKQIKLNFDLE